MRFLLLSLFLVLQITTSFAGNITKINVEELKSIALHMQQNKILFFFTSWCTHCKPITLSKDLPKNKVLFISIDEDEKAIQNFAKNMHYDVYHITPTENYKNLAILSEDLGIQFVTLDAENKQSWGVPYIALLNKNNKIETDNIQKENFSQYIK